MSDESVLHEPWHVEFDGDNGGYYVYDCDGEDVAAIQCRIGDHKVARIIAAAPEMYELLDMIRKAVSLDAGILGSCLSKIEPLLKKSRGEK